MSDLIERDKVIEYCLKLIDVERKQGSDVMNYGQERINQTDAIIAFVENLPSARPQGEWASVLAELHEQFFALEKEIRKASAEMSAVIREYVDRPKGEWMPIGAVCEVICKHCIKANGYCQHHWKCPLLTEIAELIESKEEPQTCSFGLHMDCSLCWKESHCRAIKEAERKEREDE